MAGNILELPVLFDRFLRQVFAGANKSLEKINLPITPHDIKVLMIIGENCPISTSALIALLKRDKSQMTRKINEFEKKNLVVRTPSNSDRRVSLISLTPVGEKLTSDLKQTMHAVLDNILQPLSGEEKEFLATVLRKVT